MLTPFGHLTYCTNIHSGESWKDHFAQLQQHLPAIKQSISPDGLMGLGLRLSNNASEALALKENLNNFKSWLQQQEVYVFTMNGFPYGGFHNTVVKDAVHAPDWLTEERVQYTLRLAHILVQLLPQGMEGGISTSPLSYRHWFEESAKEKEAIAKATQNILATAAALHKLKNETGKLIHLDIEPEPDGLLENGVEFLDWYSHTLLPDGVKYFQKHFHLSPAASEAIIKEHVQLCYDVCHFAIGFEDHLAYLLQLHQAGIKIGKLQISAALKATMPTDQLAKGKVLEALSQFNEPVYLHQVVCRTGEGNLLRYRDLPQALADENALASTEWRAHFHVPVFNATYEPLESTQQDIIEVLQQQRTLPFTQHLEVETYTWEVLLPHLKIPLMDSIIRELQWVQAQLVNRL
jgi:pentose-5-phosphate-3-epimerase